MARASKRARKDTVFFILSPPEQPTHDGLILRDAPDAAVLIAAAKPCEVFDIQHRKGADLLLGQPLGAVEAAKLLVGAADPCRAVIFIGFPDDEIDRSSRLHKWRKLSVPDRRDAT